LKNFGERSVFIGHYGVAFALKAKAPRLRLGLLFIAVQALDIMFALFLLFGFEHMRVAANTSSHNLYDIFQLYDMHLSHSLLGSLGWSAMTVLLARLLLPWKESLFLGLAVFSHFVLDIPMHPNDAHHPADLRIAGHSSPGIGFGLWNHPAMAVLAELSTFLLGVTIFARAMWPLRPRFWVLISVLAIFAVLPLFIPPKGTEVSFAVQILVLTGWIAFWANWVDRVRFS
jgi:hypothetical protein